MNDATTQEIDDELGRPQTLKETADYFNDVTAQEIDDELERAQTLKETAEEFIDIADGINDDERIRLEEKRGIDIDSKSWVSLDDLPLGEEVLRVKDELPGLYTAIQTLEDLTEGKIPAAEVIEKLQGAMEGLDAVESTLQDVGAEDVMRAPIDNDFQHEQHD